MKLASRSAMLSLSSAKAGSRRARAVSGLADEEVVVEVEGCVGRWGVVCEARRLVREGGRRGVVGREGGCAVERVRLWL